MDEVTNEQSAPLAKIGNKNGSGAGSGAASPVNHQTPSQQQLSGASLINQLDALLGLLENKLSALMDLVKSLNAIKAEPATVTGDHNDHQDLLFAGNQVSIRLICISFVSYVNKTTLL